MKAESRWAPLFFPLRMTHTKEDVFLQLATDCDRLDKLARLIILRKGLILQFEETEYSIDWLDSHHVEHGVAHQDFPVVAPFYLRGDSVNSWPRDSLGTRSQISVSCPEGR